MKSLKIGVIVHGPKIIDSGCAEKIIKILGDYGEVTCRLGGTMGRTAVIDAHMEDIINIEDKLLPSQSINLLSEDNDVLFLLNYGKSIITGHTFGYKVLNNAGKNINLIQIERPFEEDGVIIQWNDFKNESLINDLSKRLHLKVISSIEAINTVRELTGFNEVEGTVKRKVAGVSPGENIMMNGIIIGKVTDNHLTIIARNNEIIKMVGGEIKKHGVEKLGQVDLTKAIIKTGLLRTTDNIKPRSIKHVPNKHLKAVFLNHAAEDIYKYNFADVLVSIGDDTTLLSSDILYRFNIPIIGITDGDLDKVVLKGFKLDESLIIQLPSGYDDKVGAWIHEKIFNNEESIEIRSIDNLKEKVLNLIDKSGLKFKIVDKQL
ncbi:MAG: DUF2117 domain-containing protein [Methanosphaera sp.]|uniref:DUF2117 domain-containing protein n=1 Tax=Methanosphaera sp. TaxID=2666342 RepID=UPI002E764A45|nr:DUF2117 domain-containing protein [Methanosphaera sp.]MEE1116670.1 DUF2117 domain-containing protein [Methanosphaera sp.]MEE3324859.1 DUF2117 domain-containing protein [Methanosphaera sp.]